MEIRIYNPDLNFLGVIENYTSLLWRRKYNESGQFELYVPTTKYNIELLKHNNIVWFRGAADAGVIENLTISQTNENNQIYCSGRFLTAYMDSRLIRPTINYSGTVEKGMRKILNDAVSIPNVVLGELNDYKEIIKFQATYKNLLNFESKLAKYAEFGFRFRPDFTRKKIIFEIYKGIDRSIGQTENSRVIFSEKYDNLKSAKYTANNQLFKNVVYVGGQGEGADRQFVIVGDDSSVGLDRREMFVNASDISQDGLSKSEYLAALRQRGIEYLNENQMAQNFECITEPNVNFLYKVDYNLGDIITVTKPDWGITKNLRISELTEIYENGTMEIEPVFGVPLPEKIDWEAD
jgi:hypothetical protein